jgi:hypothetical protein
VFLGLKLAEWLSIAILLGTVFAIIYGPIKAVKITREMDEERAQKHRRLEVLQTLMRTRSTRLSPDHAGALNLIELEFYGIEPVIRTYRDYIRHLGTVAPQEEQDRFYADRTDLFVNMLHALGRSLDYTFDRHELSRLAYAPMAWALDEDLQRRNATMLNELLEGKRPLHVAPIPTPPASPFPPPPEIKKN